MRLRTDITNRDRLVLISLGLPFLLAGLWVIGIGLHWIPVNPARLHAPGWVLALIGLPSVAAGIIIMNFARSAETRTMAILGGVMFVGIALVTHWIAFGPGSRDFKQKRGGDDKVHISPMDERAGRQIFGGGAIMLDLIFVAWVGWRVSNRRKRV